MFQDSKAIYEQVTQRIIANLEQGVRPWHKPWASDKSGGSSDIPMRHNGIAYRGINVLLLWLEALEKGYTSPVWMTYKQASFQGGQVRRGERGARIVYSSPIEVTRKDEKGEDVTRKIQILRLYTVFNIAQIDGLRPDNLAPTLELKPIGERIEAVELFVKQTGATIQHGGNRACYMPALDVVQMPPFESFETKEAYYGITLHELIHWSGSKTRLDRTFGQHGDQIYAFEELVAEIGSAFLCAQLGITPEIRKDHAAYIAEWLKILGDDHRAIFRAATLAQGAADYLKNLQSNDPEPPGKPTATEGERQIEFQGASNTFSEVPVRAEKPSDAMSATVDVPKPRVRAHTSRRKTAKSGDPKPT